MLVVNLRPLARYPGIYMTRDHGEGDDKIEIWLYANENKSPCGLMDKALDF